MINFFHNSTILFSLSQEDYSKFEHLDNQCCALYLSDSNVFNNKILPHLDKCNFVLYKDIKYGPYNNIAYGVRISSLDEEVEYKFVLTQEGEKLK